MSTAIEPAFKKLEEDYAFVYYDPRGSGEAQGNAKPESFTVEQFVKDLEQLVYLVRHKYNNPTLFLMGHSWGGGLGKAFLLEKLQSFEPLSHYLKNAVAVHVILP